MSYNNLETKFYLLQKIILVGVCIIMFISCSATNKTCEKKFIIIELPDYFNGKGAIVPAGMNYLHFGKDEYSFTATIEEINEAEKILRDNLFCYVEKKYMYEMTLSKKAELLNRLVSEIENYYRHYIGDFNDKGEKEILIRLFNYSSSEGKKLFYDWEYNLHINTSEEFMRNANEYLINLAKQEIK